MAKLSDDIAAFEAMADELKAHHDGKWALVHDGELIDTFDTLDTAATEAVRRFGRGPYLIRQVGAEAVSLPASVLYQPIPAHADS